ncbi:hypothetical protein [Actinokineospora xionganensis]|uniref:DUF2269 domain-containing protein n=1 Tax=Actinokineospora xionganensis TaxID=2684470 RepID=A0ABR7L9T0_9PSEU|nr:hypothetical protein [Actinokineospora xionganensis]MBC6449461.1 hypothetical protein [Actinokineospora xionganensis]
MGNPKRWRQGALWLHVITSVGWMSQALTLFTLLTVSLTTSDAAIRLSATTMAHTLDNALLAPMANASAFTGLMLSASTAWGFYRHWWVLGKLVITLAQLYLGIFILSGALGDAATAAKAGDPTPTPVALAAGTALMAGAIAFQAWLSVAKPWNRTPWTPERPPKLPTAPTWVFAAIVIVPLFDIALSVWTGRPLPALSLVVLTAWLITRQVRRPVSAAR